MKVSKLACLIVLAVSSLLSSCSSLESLDYRSQLIDESSRRRKDIRYAEEVSLLDGKEYSAISIEEDFQRAIQEKQLRAANKINEKAVRSYFGGLDLFSRVNETTKEGLENMLPNFLDDEGLDTGISVHIDGMKIGFESYIKAKNPELFGINWDSYRLTIGPKIAGFKIQKGLPHDWIAKFEAKVMQPENKTGITIGKYFQSRNKKADALLAFSTAYHERNEENGRNGVLVGFELIYRR